MVEINDNTTENKIEMTTTRVQEEELSSRYKNNENTSILHSAPIVSEEIQKKRIVQVIGRKGENENNNIAENSKVNDDDNTSIIIHEFDATTEDPFTLESFDALIQQHAEKDKDFIIARVTTVDPSDELKTYHSYYSGHHINKILFRTQPELGLLHRMKAKNPLNNMNIIGDVYYYVVKAASVKKLPTFAKSSSMSTTSRKTLKIKENDVMIVATSSFDKIEEKHFTPTEIKEIKDFIPRSNGLRSAPPSIWNFDTKEDEDEKAVVIEMESSSNNNNNNKRWSANDSLKPLPKAFTHNSSTTPEEENLEKLLVTFKSQAFDSINNNKEDSQSSKEFVINNNISPSRSENSENNKNSENNDGQPNDLLPTITHSSSHSISNEGEDTIYYKAIFYATDDDFLMRSAIRQFFKSNALDQADAQLFTINTSHNNYRTGTPPSTQLERMVAGGTFIIDPTVVIDGHSNRNVESQDAPSASRWRRIINNMRMNKGLRWLVLMYMIFGFLLIRFVVSETYAYLMAFLLMFCLFLVFCVGNGVGMWGR